MKDNKEKSENVISVENLSKQFIIPHDKANTLKGAFVNLFHKKSYEVFDALKDISFEIKKGEFFGIIGRNGSGKSTLLKILAGIYTPDSGKVKIHGRVSPFLELGIGFNPELSGRDNIYLNGTVLGLTEKQIDEKFDSIVAFSELGRFIDQKLKNYSSGMQVRLAFSVSIHANRDILLMDEVLAVGDSNFQSKCINEFNKYKDENKTVILVTHDISVVQRYCDRAMLLRNGKIEMIGNSEEVGNKYIYQNMSDEEKRIVDENKKTKISSVTSDSFLVDEEEKQEKVAEITEVKFLDKDGNEKNVFATGDDMSIRVYFKINKRMPIFNFGLSLFSINREYIFGTNTIFDKIDTEKILEKGYYQINIKDIPFTTNTYYIHTSIAGENFNSFYAFIEKTKLFKVFCNRRGEGLFNITHSWDNNL